MIKFLRTILLIPKPKITEDEALQIAHEAYKNYGKQWNPEIIEELRNWLVINPKKTLGAARIVIDQQTGKVVSVSVLPR